MSFMLAALYETRAGDICAGQAVKLPKLLQTVLALARHSVRPVQC